MDSQKQQIVEKLQAANNILLTVSRDPSVDQLAACIALTLLLNKMDKHATAVFSGKVPSTIDFLKPEETLEKNTDSLRDFIIALDKSKADKLRYKVEDRVVKIFITPYRTSLSSDDLEFSQGDFNVDVVLALGVHQQADLDDAITAHGRILHDATVMCINTTPNGDLGSINWVGQNASSLSELATELAQSFDKSQLDEQIATALLTGIVAETDRFKNDKTTATTMGLSADLMKAGANQQLVADELEQTVEVPQLNGDDKTDDNETAAADTAGSTGDGSLAIDHDQPADDYNGELPAPVADEAAESPQDSDTLDFASRPLLPDSPEEASTEKDETDDSSRSLITEPPTFGGTLTANSRPEDTGTTSVNMMPEDGSSANGATPPMTLPVPPAPVTPDSTVADEPSSPITTEPEQAAPSEPAEPPVAEPVAPSQPTPSVEPVVDSSPQSQPAAPVFQPPVPPAPAEPAETLTELEQSVHSDHLADNQQATNESEIDKARDEVMRALSEQPSTLPPIEALNAQTVDLDKPAPTPEYPAAAAPQPVSINPPEQAPFASSPADKPLDMPLPPTIALPPAQAQPPTDSPSDSPDSPPPVPPPFLPGNFGK